MTDESYIKQVAESVRDQRDNIGRIFERVDKLSMDVATLTEQGKRHSETSSSVRQLFDTQMEHEHRIINIESDQKGLREDFHELKISSEKADSQRREGVKSGALALWSLVVVIAGAVATTVLGEIVKHIQ